MNNTSNTDTNSTSKAALIKDLDSSYVPENQYSHGRNIIRNSREGNLGTIGCEPSTLFSCKLPYKFLGAITLPEKQLMIFSGDNVNSEIGLVNLKTDVYTTLKNLKCFNFNENFPITGVAKKDFQKGVIATFTDKNNPVRRIELNKLSSLTDCDDILLWKKIQRPSISVRKGQVGSVPNGTFSVAMAYVIDGQIFSDVYSITNRIELFSDTSSNSIEVTLNNLDSEFKEFALIVIGNYIDPVTKGVTKVAKIIGNFSTKIKNISVTDFINPIYQNIPLSTLILRKKTWNKAGIISSNSKYLILADLVARPEENYQLKAMQIKAQYVVAQVPADYYKIDGFDVGYYRDENYNWSIQGIYNTGEETDAFHIGGRLPQATDIAPVSSSDVYEHDKSLGICDTQTKIPRWQVENTAGKMFSVNNDFVCGRRVIGFGEFGYFESTDVYPDNAAMFGPDANRPIRYHKFPDETKVPRYTVINGKTYINILGVRFLNVPKFDNPDIVGYKIIRSDRKGGNGTVIARGLLTNMRSYKDNQIGSTVIYANYPVNNLGPDKFLSSTQTSFKNNSEHDYNPLTDYYNDRFAFYSPHTSYEPRYSLGTELKIEAEEIANITGKFELVYKHPKFKLMNQFAFWISAAVGFIESALTLAGKTSAHGTSEFSVGLTAGTTHSFTEDFNINSVADLINLDIIGYITSQIAAGAFTSVIGTVRTVLTLIASLGLKIPYSILAGIKQADDTLQIIYNFTGYTDYVYQYNSHALFNRSIPMPAGNKRRFITNGFYVPSDVISVDDQILNNYFREQYVYLQLNKTISKPTVEDTSQNTLSGFGLCGDIHKEAQSIGSCFYASIKVPNPNQYGPIDSTSYVSIHSEVIPFELPMTPVLFGGDCIIARSQQEKKMQFFNQNAANTNYPDGVEYDYRLYRNIAYPRFWLDSTKYDFSQLLSTNIVNFTKFSRTTSSKHNLDCKTKHDGKSIARIDDAYMYLSNNSVIDYFVECDYNISFREKTEQPFYSDTNKNLSQIFRSDRLSIPEEFKISRAYSDIYTTEVFAKQQRVDFDPLNPIPTNQRNSVIYSQPSFNLQEVDNWQYFLPANFFSFSQSDFGFLTTVKKIDQDRLIFLFTEASPYYSMGRDFLELEGSGRKITIGDGGLFAQDPREILPTDNKYGASTSKYAFSNTHGGRFYPSENQGRIINSDTMQDIAAQGLMFWCKNYMPIFLYNYFPNYPEVENPLAGVGYLTVFDSSYEILYITKRDFSPKPEYAKDITWNGSFKYKGNPISLKDKNYFNDISWTLSYSVDDKSFISHHDWHPDWVIQTDTHFISVKDDKLWKHNVAFDSFCNYYGEQFPFEVEPTSNSGQNVEIIRSIEYILEVYKYKNSGRDKFHVLNENFDYLIVNNSEQISPLQHLVLGKEDPIANLDYPIRTSNIGYDVLYFKEENKYRVNQFWDAVKDRGEFSSSEVHLFPTDESGYKNVINPVAIDVNKPEEQRKKFRHYSTKFRLIKSNCGSSKFLLKVFNAKKVISSR